MSAQQFPAVVATSMDFSVFSPNSHILNQQQSFPMHHPLMIDNNFSVPTNFNRPFSARPTAQLRRASSASMEAGKMLNTSAPLVPGTRPASLQHHELLYGTEQQRMTPLPRKFEPVEATLLEEKVQEEMKSERHQQQSMMTPAANHCHHQMPAGGQKVPSSSPSPVHALRRHNSMAASTESAGTFREPSPASSKAPHSALPGCLYPPVFPSSNGGASANPSSAANVDSNVTLWQFLLELLATNDHPNLIQWTNNEGEFKLLDAEAVARLWGIRKGKPNMNYDKLSRALRYYYDKQIIKKVIGQKFVYRFVMDNSRQANAAAELGLGTAGNPELVRYAMSKAVTTTTPASTGPAHQRQQQMEIEANASVRPQQSNGGACLSLADFPPKTVSTLNPNNNNNSMGHHQQLRGTASHAMTPSPANSSSSPAGSVESSSGVSSGSGISASFAVPGANGTFAGQQMKTEPGLINPTTSSAAGPAFPSAPLLAEKARLTRKRKSPLEHSYVSGPSASQLGGSGPCLNSCRESREEEGEGSAPKIGCTHPSSGPSLSRRGRPQPLDLTSVNSSSSSSSVNHLAGQMSQMVASSPLFQALQQHHQQNQLNQQQQSPLLSAAGILSSALMSNYVASPLASVASPLMAQAAAFQLASNLMATLSPNTATNHHSHASAADGVNNTNNYGLSSSNGASQNNQHSLHAGNLLYNHLHSALRRNSEAASNSWDNSAASLSAMPKEDGYALTTPIGQLKTPQQQQSFSNSAMLSAMINQMTNGQNTPMQAQQPLFQFPPSSNVANLAQTLAMLSPALATQSPYLFASQMAALQTPKFSSANIQNSSFNQCQRSPDPLKTPMGALNFEWGALAAAAANKK